MSKIDEMVRDGLAHHQAGRRDAARGLYLKAIARQPSHPAANHLLGLLLLQQGEADEAVRHLQRAVRGNRSAEYLGNLGTALNAAGRHGEAVDAFDAALALQPKSPGILNNRGMALRSLGRHDDAIESYRSALKLAPREAGVLRNLGNVLAGVGRFPEAIDAYRLSLAARPGFGAAALGLCNALSLIGKADVAADDIVAMSVQFPRESELQRAAGRACRLAGRPADAIAAYRRAIAANPTDAAAHRLLGLALVRSDPADPEVTAIARLLERPDLPVGERVQLCFAMGQAKEDLGESDQSFEWFVRANDLLREVRSYDVAAEGMRLRGIMGSFDTGPLEPLPPLGDPVGPIFIVGLPRSGKTSLEGRLARHPQVFGAGELGVLRNLLSQIAPGSAGHPITPRQADELGRRYGEVAGNLALSRRPIDTTPSNFELVGVIRQALPTARVLFCVREPHGQIAALFTKYFAKAGHDFAESLSDSAAVAAMAGNLAAFWQRRFPGFVYCVDSSSPGAGMAEMRGVLGHLGLHDHADCHAPFESEPRVGVPLMSADVRRRRLMLEIDMILGRHR